MTDSFVQGNDVVLGFTVTKSDGTPQPITGATIIWSMKRDLDSAAVITKETGSGITIIDGENGEFDVTINDSDSEDIYGKFLQEAVIITVAGKTLTVTTEDGGFEAINVRRRITPAT